MILSTEVLLNLNTEAFKRVIFFMLMTIHFFTIDLEDAVCQATYIPTIPDDFSSKWIEYDERTATTVRSTLKQTYKKTMDWWFK